MNTEQFYNSIHADYQNILRRFRKESMIIRFLKKFEQDPSFEQLKLSLEKKDQKEAFMAAHTLKGIAQNLSLDPIYEKAAVITDLLRQEWNDEAVYYFEQLVPIHEKCIAGIQELG